VETPRTTSTATIPSTRETIDLISDDEGDTIRKKKEPSSSPNNILPSIPTSITTRKRVKMGDIQDETPSRPPAKKQKSPTGEALPTPRSAPSQPQAAAAIIPSRILSPQPDPFADSTFTQIPDSEGEDNDDCFEDLNSDDIPLEAKEILGGTSSIADRSAEPVDRDDHIVPESPMKAGNDGEYVNNVNNRVYPTIPSVDNVTMKPRNSFGASTSTLSLVLQLGIRLIADDTTEFTSKDP